MTTQTAYRKEIEHLDVLFDMYARTPEIKEFKNYSYLKLRILNYIANSIIGFALLCIFGSLALIMWRNF